MNDRYYSRIYPEHAFGKLELRNGILPFYSRLKSLVRPDSVVLEVGCGHGVHRDLSEGFF